MKNPFLYLLLLFTALTFAQSVSPPTVMPASPTAYEFLKYGEIPVGKYTGIPNINIPIYTINAAGFSVPINLTYHSNGIKVNEEASWVGLGWSLNPEGNIVQIVNGYDDFGPYKNRDFPDVDEIADIASGGLAPSGILDGCTGTYIEINGDDFWLPTNTDPCSNVNDRSTAVPPDLLMNGQVGPPLDFEPDVFKFSVLGYSGTFILDWETEEFRCITDSKIIIESMSTPLDEIKINLPGDIICIFSIKEETKEGPITPNDPNVDDDFEDYHKKRTSRVFKLDEVQYRNDIVEFEYITTNEINSHTVYSESYLKYETTDNPYNHSFDFSDLHSNTPYTYSPTSTHQSYTYLSKITFNQGVVLFNLSNRSDIIGAKKLDNIQVKPSETSTKIIKNFNFNYNYFIGHSNSTSYTSKTSQERKYRLKLNTLEELGKPEYQFFYNQTQLPEKTAFAMDYWGYYNGKLNNTGLFPNIKRFNYAYDDIVFPVRDNNNRSSREEYAKAAILEKIIYPTGGSTEFSYELNSFSNYILPNYTDNANTIYQIGHISYGSGLRISKMDNYSKANEKVSQKVYTYEGGKIMTPIRFYNKAFISRYDYLNTINHPSGEYQNVSGFRVKTSGSSIIPPSLNASGNHVGYDAVEEYIVSNTVSNYNPEDFGNPNENPENTRGKIRDVFENHEDEGLFLLGQNNTEIVDTDWQFNGKYIELNLPTREKNDTRNGSLLEQYIYDNTGDLKKRIINTYGHGIRYNCVNGIRVGPVLSNVTCATYQNHIKTIKSYLLGVYPIRGIDSYLDTSETIDFLDNGSIKTETEYTFNDKVQLTQKKTKTSDDDFITEDFSPSGRCPSIASNYYKRYDGKIIDSYIATYIGCDQNSPVDVQGKSGIRMQYTYGSNYPNNITNLQSYAMNTGKLKTLFIWDYYGKYPLAKVQLNRDININTSWINSVVNASQNFDSQGLRDALATFRHNLLNTGSTSSRAESVTTYTYENLVGVKTITDTTGKTTYFYYDDDFRLDYVTDHEGNRLSENEYNYKLLN